MIPPCPKCLSNEHVDRDGGPYWLCNRRSCWVVFTGDPSEQAKYAQWRREQERNDG